MGTQFRTCAGISAVLTAAIAIPAALASRSGADSMYTAGPASSGAGCSACHAFNSGTGGVELVDAPRRYRTGDIYQMGVHVFDMQQKAAGFEISAEDPLAHRGTLLIADALRTQFADGGTNPFFVTHTDEGMDDSVAHWDADGYEYTVGWQAPATDEGPVTFFASGNAVNDGQGFFNDRYYFTYVASHFAVPGDADADTDLDLRDFAGFQGCFGASLEPGDPCEFLETHRDDAITADDTAHWIPEMTGPTAEFPGEYVLADAVRGGKLYDRWWVTVGVPEPTGDHPLYPEVGIQSGSVTFRCKECHGWDYKGVAGQYATGSHFTGIIGVLGSARSATDIFDLLRAPAAEAANGHEMLAYGLTDADLWDLTKFVREGLIDTDIIIGPSGEFSGNLITGSSLYGLSCINCHGDEGTAINFGTPSEPEYIGTLANDNPWEFLHKARHGQPGAPMPATELLGWSDQIVGDLGVYAQFLAE